MTRVVIDYTDGRFSMIKVEGSSDKSILIEERVWKAYQRHLDEDAVFQNLMTILDNQKD